LSLPSFSPTVPRIQPATINIKRGVGLELAGFTTQAHFLAATGIDKEMQRLQGEHKNAFARLVNQARRRGLDVDLSGFQLRHLRHTL
jgi:hypothetical protein